MIPLTTNLPLPIKLLLIALLIHPLPYGNSISVSVLGRKLPPGFGLSTRPCFIPAHFKRQTAPRINPLGSGWGLTDKYSWREDDDYVYVNSTLGTGVKSSQISVDLTRESIKVEKEGSKIPAIEGKTKGRVDVTGSFWTLEENKGISELHIALKKLQTYNQNWSGVLIGENVQLKDYHGASDAWISAPSTSVEPNEVYCAKHFRKVDSKTLSELFSRWIKRDSNAMVPFGKPTTELGFSYVPEASGDKLLFLGVDRDEYMNVVIKSTDEDPESSDLLFLNGPQTSILKGLCGLELKDKLSRSLNTLLTCFESDVNKLITLTSATQVPESSFDYAGSSATLSLDNMDEYIKYHKSLDSIIKRESKNGDKSSEKGDSKERKVANKETSDDKSQESMVARLTEALNSSQKHKPRDQIKKIITNLKDNLALDSMQVDDLFRNAMERLDMQMADSKQREKECAQIKASDSWFQSQMEQETIIERTSDPFLAIVNNPANMESSLLVRKYHSISETQQEKLRHRWNRNAKRLKLLLDELFSATPDLLSTICNNYRDLLISEDYPTLMKSYIVNSGVASESERNRLNFLNEFVLSIYKDAEIYTLRDEQRQLMKIGQICDWAMNDFENLNDLVEANKQKYDANFLSYVKLLISKETEKMEESGGTQSPLKNPWLSILTIIQIAVTSLIEADIAEDTYLITHIVYQNMPKVRSYMTEFILATMPRSDWKPFKQLVFSITGALMNKPPEEREMGNIPDWVPEACFQLRDEIESMIPDWVIDELMSENDRMLMLQNDKMKSPLFQLKSKERYQTLKQVDGPPRAEKATVQ